MPQTAELAIQILFDLCEERKKALCPWMGGGMICIKMQAAL